MVDHDATDELKIKLWSSHFEEEEADVLDERLGKVFEASLGNRLLPYAVLGTNLPFSCRCPKHICMSRRALISLKDTGIPGSSAPENPSTGRNLEITLA